jgi:hypothetical protein
MGVRMSHRRGPRDIEVSCQGVLPSKGGESVEEKIKLVVAVLQLLLAIAELVRILSAYF